MKVKQRNVCQTCRKRKLGCDGKSPECSQCVFSGLRCDGYPTDWTFLSQNTPTPRQKKGQAIDSAISQAATPATIQQVQTTLDIAPSLPRQILNQPNANHLSALIVQNFVPGSGRTPNIYNSDYSEPRTCGSWVEVLSILPCLNTGSLVLTRAVKALSASMLSRPHMANTDYSSTYHEAIHTLRKSFGVNGNSVNFELIPAVMCLALAEMMIPDSAAAMAEHIKAAGLMFQAYGPDACTEGFGHKLFVGFRPLLTMQAIQQRQPVFLAFPAWVDIPFSIFDPSLMQQLLNEAVMLPSLLHEADTVIQSPDVRSHPARIDQIFDLFINFASRLENFETTLCVDGRPPYWPHGTAKDTLVPFWYPNITHANAFTHLWALKIICMAEMKRIAAYLPHKPPKESLSPGRLHLNLAENDLLMLVLARQIYLSTEYLMQDEMKLFGPSSTFFPLKLAYQTFKKDAISHKADIACIEKILDQLDRKGLLSARSFVFDRR